MVEVTSKVKQNSNVILRKFHAARFAVSFSGAFP